MTIRVYSSTTLATDIDSYVGPFGEITVDANGTLRVHDNQTSGGRPLSGGVVQGATPPENPDAYTLWYDEVSGRLYVWYDGAWIDASPNTGGGGGGNVTTGGGVVQSEIPPENPTDSTLWFDLSLGRLYVWYDDVWVDASPAAGNGSGIGNIEITGTNIHPQGYFGNVVVQTNDDVTWTFDTAGTLTTPGETVIGTRLNYGQNGSTLNSPQPDGSTDRIRLWDFNSGNPSGFNYSIGVEGGHIWFQQDVISNDGGFKFYTQYDQVLKVGGRGDVYLSGNINRLPDIGARYSIANFDPSGTVSVYETVDINDGDAITIFGVHEPVELNGVWYISKQDDNNFTIYTDQSLTTIVDASSWNAYTMGGVVYGPGVDSSNLSITNNEHTWSFNSDGNFQLPTNGDIVDSDGNSVLGAVGSTRWDVEPAEAGCPIYAELTPVHFDVYTQKSHLNLENGGYWNIGSNFNGTGLHAIDADVTLYSNYGNVVVRTNTSPLNFWTFGPDGNLSLPTNGTISYAPGDASSWNGTAPTTIQEAIDRLAAAIKALNSTGA